MSCNSQIHDELNSIGECICPFCDRLLVEVNKVVKTCCDEQELENIDYNNTCVNCGLVHGDVYVVEYFDFYEKMHLIRQKSIYHRKYHIENVMNSISFENNIKLTHHQRERIYKVFNEINSVLHEVKGPRTYLARVSKEVKFHFRSMASSSFDQAPCC